MIRLLLQKLVVAQMTKNVPPSVKSKASFVFHNSPSLNPNLTKLNQINSFIHYFSSINFKYLDIYTCVAQTECSFTQGK